MKVKPYVITERVLERLKREGKDLICIRCGKELRAGDRVMPRRRRQGHHYRVKRYHEECWDGMFFAPDRKRKD